MKNRYFIDMLTSVDISESVKVDGKVIKNYKGVIFRKNIYIPPFRKVIEKLFASRQK